MNSGVSPQNALAELINILLPQDALKLTFRHFSICLQLYEKKSNAETWVRTWFALAQSLEPSRHKTDNLGSFYAHYDDFLADAIMHCGSLLEAALMAFFDGDAVFCRVSVARVLDSIITFRLGYRWSVAHPASWNAHIRSSNQNISHEEASEIHEYRFSEATKEYLQNIWLALYYDIEDVMLNY